MTPEDRAELRELLAAATPGPWGAADEHGNWPGAAPAWCVSRMDGEKWLYDVFYHASQSDGAQAERDSRLIVALRNHAESLLAENERLAGQVARIEALITDERLVEAIATEIQRDAFEVGCKLARAAGSEYLEEPFPVTDEERSLARRLLGIVSAALAAVPTPEGETT